MKTIELTYAERYLIHLLLRGLEEGDHVVAKNVRGLNRGLHLHQARREMQKVEEDCREDRLEGRPDWYDMQDGVKIKVDKWEEVRDPETGQKVMKVTGQEEKIVWSVPPEHEFEVDESYLSWLRDRCLEKDWSKGKIRGQDGRPQEITFSPDGMQLEVFADLIDKLSDAHSADPARDSKKKE